MNPIVQWVIGIIGAGGFGKFAWDFVTAFTQPRKAKTDNAVNLVNSATGYADKLNDRLDRINERFDLFRREQEERNRAQEARNRAQDRLLLEHSRWDHRTVAQLRSKGIPVEEPPPLFLPEGTSP